MARRKTPSYNENGQCFLATVVLTIQTLSLTLRHRTANKMVLAIIKTESTDTT